jgi:hypothetical protein
MNSALDMKVHILRLPPQTLYTQISIYVNQNNHS